MDSTQNSNSKMVTGLFPDRDSAERAYGDLGARGYGPDGVTRVTSGERRQRPVLAEGATDAATGRQAAPAGDGSRARGSGAASGGSGSGGGGLMG